MVSVIQKSYCLETKLLILAKEINHYALEMRWLLPKQNIKKGQAFQIVQVFSFLYLFYESLWDKYGSS